MKQKRGAYAPEFRLQMVELVNAGRRIKELAQEFGCHKTSISAWVRQAQADEIEGVKPDAPLTTAEPQELSMLRRRLRQVQMERDILAKGYGLVCQPRQRQDVYTLIQANQAHFPCAHCADI